MKGYTLHTQKGGMLSRFKPKTFKLITIFRHSYHWPLGALDKNKSKQKTTNKLCRQQYLEASDTF